MAREDAIRAAVRAYKDGKLNQEQLKAVLVRLGAATPKAEPAPAATEAAPIAEPPAPEMFVADVPQPLSGEEFKLQRKLDEAAQHQASLEQMGGHPAMIPFNLVGEVLRQELGAGGGGARALMQRGDPEQEEGREFGEGIVPERFLGEVVTTMFRWMAGISDKQAPEIDEATRSRLLETGQMDRLGMIEQGNVAAKALGIALSFAEPTIPGVAGAAAKMATKARAAKNAMKAAKAAAEAGAHADEAARVGLVTLPMIDQIKASMKVGGKRAATIVSEHNIDKMSDSVNAMQDLINEGASLTFRKAGMHEGLHKVVMEVTENADASPKAFEFLFQDPSDARAFLNEGITRSLLGNTTGVAKLGLSATRRRPPGKELVTRIKAARESRLAIKRAAQEAKRAKEAGEIVSETAEEKLLEDLIKRNVTPSKEPKALLSNETLGDKARNLWANSLSAEAFARAGVWGRRIADDYKKMAHRIRRSVGRDLADIGPRVREIAMKRKFRKLRRQTNDAIWKALRGVKNLAEYKGPHDKDAARIWIQYSQVYQRHLREAQRLGIKSRHADGVWRTFNPKDMDSVPMVLKPGSHKNKKLVRLVMDHHGLKRSAAEDLIKRYNTLEGIAGYDLAPLLPRLADEFIETNPHKAMMAFVEASATRLEEIRAFGQAIDGAHVPPKLQTYVDRAVKAGHDRGVLNRMVRNLLRDDPAFADTRDLERALTGFQVLTKMDKSFLSNLSDVSKVAAAHGSKNTIKAIFKAMEGPTDETLRAGGLPGVMLDITDQARGAVGIGKLKLEARDILRNYGFFVTEEFIDRVGIHAAQSHADQVLRSLHTSFRQGRLSQGFFNNIRMRNLMRLTNGTEDEIFQAIKTGKFTEAQKNAIGTNGINMVKPMDRTDLPLYWNKPGVKIFTQFKSWAFHHQRWMINHLVAEARRGNVAPAARFMVWAGMVGGPVGATKRILRGQPPTKEDETALRAWWNRSIEESFAGPLLDGMDYVMNDRSTGLIAFVAGPTAGTVSAAAGHAMGIYDDVTQLELEGTSEAAKAALKSVPFVGDPFVNLVLEDE